MSLFAEKYAGNNKNLIIFHLEKQRSGSYDIHKEKNGSGIICRMQ
jgi:hypothetical protein